MGEKSIICGKTITNEDIYALLQQSIQQNIEIKTEIRDIKREINSHNEVVENLERKIDVLEIENEELRTKLRSTQRKIRKNNILIFGISEEKNESISEVVLDFVTKCLKVPLSISEINNVYRITNKNKVVKSRPILLELTTYLKKEEIFSRKALLKGGSISISEDLIEEDRNERKVLYNHYLSAKIKGYPAQLKKRHVIINGERYNYQDLEKSDTPHTETNHSIGNRRESVSTPTSPVGNFNTEKVVFELPALPKSTKYQSTIENPSCHVEKPAIATASQEGRNKQSKIKPGEKKIETRSRSNSKSSQKSERSGEDLQATKSCYSKLAN